MVVSGNTYSATSMYRQLIGHTILLKEADRLIRRCESFFGDDYSRMQEDYERLRKNPPPKSPHFNDLSLTIFVASQLADLETLLQQNTVTYRRKEITSIRELHKAYQEVHKRHSKSPTHGL